MLDLQMRVMTGWEFRAEQRKDPVLTKIPVVAMTAGRWKESDLREFTARIDKPITLRVLQELLRTHCDISTSAAPAKEES
jgi:CheY-like chemotaxis protein